MKLYINYRTGAGNEWVDGTLDDAKRIADERPAYTQQNIMIEDENGVGIAERRWYGVAYDGHGYPPERRGVFHKGGGGLCRREKS